MQYLEVPWALCGALVHNLVCALCISPALHKDLSMMARCENALSGFLLLDMFRLLAEGHCKSHGLARGSTFMAGQTCYNMAGVALTTAAMCYSKPSALCPWLQGTARLSEMTIEELFGMLRGQTGNSQLSSRQYFQASARYMLKQNDALNKKQKVYKPVAEKALTDEEFLGMLVHFVSFYIYHFDSFCTVSICFNLIHFDSFCMNCFGVSHFVKFCDTLQQKKTLSSFAWTGSRRVVTMP